MFVRMYWKINKSIRKKSVKIIFYTQIVFWGDLLFLISSLLGTQTLMISLSVKALVKKKKNMVERNFYF